MDKEWIELMKQAKGQGLQPEDVRQQLSDQSTGTKFVYETDGSEKVTNRILEVSDVDDLTVISMAVRHYQQHFIGMGWDQSDDEELQEVFKNIVLLDGILSGTIRPNRQTGGKTK